MSGQPSSTPRSSKLYEANIVLILDEADERRGGFLNEFSNANDAKRGRYSDGRTYCVKYQIVAPTNKEAYRRAADLVEAKIRAGGFGTNAKIEDIVTSQID